MACISAAVEVASGSLTGQTGAIAAFTLFTPPAAGLFRLSVRGVFTTVGSISDFGVALSWTDESGANNGAVQYGTLPSPSYVIYSSASDPIQLSASVEPGFNSTYNLHWVLEQL